ncbi:hypothetical protein HHUSO_G35392 [Huso huso]|uniref:Ig-like domain-containing protein n=1 Tax=Huso huso TaxID=61971 RepID=A0ABR0Y3Q3_HUSHU
MQCSIGTALVESSLISWYRARPGGVLEPVTQFIRHVLTTGRYTGEIHNENGSFSLTIGNVQRSDSGLYFCIVRASRTFTPGSSSRLVVTDPEIIPSIQFFSPGSDERKSGWTESVPAVCLVRDASPLWGRVLWTIPGVSAEPESGRDEGLIGPNGAYTVTSHVTISAEQWESGGVECRVLNNATGEIFTARKTNTNTHKDADCFPYLVWRYVLIPGVLVTMWIHFAVVHWKDKKQRGRFQEEI